MTPRCKVYITINNQLMFTNKYCKININKVQVYKIEQNY